MGQIRVFEIGGKRPGGSRKRLRAIPVAPGNGAGSSQEGSVFRDEFRRAACFSLAFVPVNVQQIAPAPGCTQRAGHHGHAR